MSECEVCYKAVARKRLIADDGVESSLYVCPACIRKMLKGKPVMDIYDFVWWSDKKGAHTAHRDSREAKRVIRARANRQE